MPNQISGCSNILNCFIALFIIDLLSNLPTLELRDDCAKCTACLDKPKFGGKGTKKQACVEKVCAAMTTAAGATAAAKGRQLQQQKSLKAVADAIEGNVDPIVSVQKIE